MVYDGISVLIHWNSHNVLTIHILFVIGKLYKTGINLIGCERVAA